MSSPLQPPAFPGFAALILILGGLIATPTAVPAPVPGSPPEATAVQIDGPPRRYFVDVERYRFPVPNVDDPAFYPIRHEPVRRETYLQALEALGLEALARRPEQGMEGPRVFLPLLVKFASSGDPVWAEACRRMLTAFHETIRRQVRERGWVWQFEHPAALLPWYRRVLVEGGAMSPDAPWFRDLWLDYCRSLHVWDSEPVEWRGGCHRSMPEAYAKGLAARWYPDIPEAGRWSRYSELVFRDFWRTQDVPQNDTGYMMGPLILLAAGGDLWTGDDRVYTDPGMQRLWDRLRHEVTPDGAINPYGPNGGWNSTANYRIAMLERVAAKTRDGRHRFAAHRLFNHLRYQSAHPGSPLAPDAYQPDPGDAWLIALAWLFADDTVVPVPPEPGSLWTRRREAARVPHTDKTLLERLIGNADPDPQRGHLCCSWFMTDREWPDKLVLRSGWNPGDLFALVELHPTSFPANPGGIMGLNRWGAPFTQIVTSKGDSPENRLFVQDLDGSAHRRLHPDRLRIDEFWRAGRMPDIQSEVTYFEETPEATYARIRVRNMDGLPVTYEREFVFARNRFLATRERVTFEESFRARVAPLWNTQNIGPQVGPHWANTFLSAPVGDNGNRSLRTPPADLLVWFAPRPDCRLHLVDRCAEDPRAEACPNQVRYVWEGTPGAGECLVFTQVYVPHPPHRARPTSNNPNPGARAAYANDLQATAGAAGIQVVQDSPETSILHLTLEPGREEWVLFNPAERAVDLGGTPSRAAYAYRAGPAAAQP